MENLDHLRERLVAEELVAGRYERQDERFYVHLQRREAEHNLFLTKIITSGLAVAFQSGDTHEQAVEDNADAAEGAETDSMATAAVTLGNLATAIAPLMVGTAGVPSIQTLAAVLPAVIAAAQGAAKTSAAAPAAS